MRIGAEPLSLHQLRGFARSQERLELDPGCRAAVERAAQAVATIVARGERVYGVNTGFGLLASTSISADNLKALQRNLVLSHSAGTGPLLDDAAVRLILALKIAALAQGYSGVRWSLIEAMVRMAEAEVYPCIPSKGSVGASGDLAPLAHLSAALIGVGEVRHRGEILAAAEGLRRAGLSPIELGPKEGLALLNGTQVSTALALIGLFAIEDDFAAALVAGALSVDAAKGSDTPFDPRIHAIRGHPGQAAVAAIYLSLLSGSPIRASHLDCKRVQDPYSLRCQPQVMGACLDHLRFAAEVIAREANAVSDNPLVFADTGEVLSGGNFHAEPVAMASDVLALVAAEIGALSERRIALLIDHTISELPPFLVREGGLNSGFMIAQVTAAALASENKSLAHPASVDSLPTSANQEDHVSMATFAARRLGEMADNTAGIVAIELLAAAQGVEFHAPLETSPALAEAKSLIRAVVPPYDRDRPFAPDIAAAKRLIAEGALARFIPPETLPSFGR
ncbi:MAG TPA: histidine ammonia-lyase [Stellaceae bacterium]|jgi:histidine ammonia-lyase|nr:histidine ammonia-lyase [Stellaceae bacterium]